LYIFKEKKKMKNSLVVKAFSLLIIASFALAACGGGATQAPAGGDTAPATQAPAVSGGDTSAEVALRWRTRPDNQEEINVYNNISQELDGKLDGMVLVYEPGGTEGSNYQDQLRTEVAAGTAPDVFWIPGTDIADFAERGLILNISELAAQTEGFDVDAFYPGPMYHLTFNPENSASWC
jgi:multiple sugar transport system substrate-binding protein